MFSFVREYDRKTIKCLNFGRRLFPVPTLLFFKHHVSRDVHPLCSWIKDTISLRPFFIADEHANACSIGQFVDAGSDELEVRRAAESAEVIHSRLLPSPCLVQSDSLELLVGDLFSM
jgi:hypothetical protein